MTSIRKGNRRQRRKQRRPAAFLRLSLPKSWKRFPSPADSLKRVAEIKKALREEQAVG